MRCTACGRLPSESCCETCHAIATPAVRIIGARLDMRERRKELGMSAEIVALEVGVSPSMIWAWERGAHRPNPETEARWFEALAR